MRLLNHICTLVLLALSNILVCLVGRLHYLLQSGIRKADASTCDIIERCSNTIQIQVDCTASASHTSCHVNDAAAAQPAIISTSILWCLWCDNGLRFAQRTYSYASNYREPEAECVEYCRHFGILIVVHVLSSYSL